TTCPRQAPRAHQWRQRRRVDWRAGECRVGCRGRRYVLHVFCTHYVLQRAAELMFGGGHPAPAPVPAPSVEPFEVDDSAQRQPTQGPVLPVRLHFLSPYIWLTRLTQHRAPGCCILSLGRCCLCSPFPSISFPASSASSLASSASPYPSSVS